MTSSLRYASKNTKVVNHVAVIQHLINYAITDQASSPVDNASLAMLVVEQAFLLFTSM